MTKWTLTVRNGPRVQRFRFDSLDGALDEMQKLLDELTPEARRQAIEVFRRRFEAVRQVVMRAEISGPRGPMGAIRGGVDVRGDGSAEAYTGHLKRSLVALEPQENAREGLRRVLTEKLKT
jgi:hypothetical protein